MVAIPSPKTTAVANCFHQREVGLSTEYPPLIKFKLNPNIIGANPAMVVIVVSNTGLIRCSAVLIMASMRVKYIENYR